MSNSETEGGLKFMAMKLDACAQALQTALDRADLNAAVAHEARAALEPLRSEGARAEAAVVVAEEERRLRAAAEERTEVAERKVAAERAQRAQAERATVLATEERDAALAELAAATDSAQQLLLGGRERRKALRERLRQASQVASEWQQRAAQLQEELERAARAPCGAPQRCCDIAPPPVWYDAMPPPPPPLPPPPPYTATAAGATGGESGGGCGGAAAEAAAAAPPPSRGLARGARTAMKRRTKRNAPRTAAVTTGGSPPNRTKSAPPARANCAQPQRRAAPTRVAKGARRSSTSKPPAPRTGAGTAGRRTKKATKSAVSRPLRSASDDGPPDSGHVMTMNQAAAQLGHELDRFI